MPVYREKEVKNGKKVNKLVDGKQKWFIRVYVDKKQIVRRNKKWLGKDGYNLAVQEEQRLKKMTQKRIDSDRYDSFNDLVETYKEEIKKKTKESSYYTYFNVIENQILPHIPPNTKKSELNINVFRGWHKALEAKKLSIEYLNKCHHIMKAILDIGMNFFGMETNYESILGPFKENRQKVIPDNKKIKYITFNEFTQFISAIDDINWKTFFMLLYYTGMRKGEVQALNWNDIDFQNNEIIVNKTLTIKSKERYKITSTKNLVNRKVKMSDVLKKQLLEYKKYKLQNPNFDNNWFVFGDTRFFPQTTIDRKKRYFFNLSGVQEITIKEFRHSHVSLLINEYVRVSMERNMKVDMAKFFLMMSNRMGHTIEVMQNTYMHLFPSIQDEIVTLLDGLA